MSPVPQSVSSSAAQPVSATSPHRDGVARGRVLRLGDAVSIPWSVRVLVVAAALTLVILVLAALEIATGSISYTVSEIIAVLSGGGEPTASRVVLGIRVPRLLTAAFVGASLGVAGATFQSISRNALGSPDVIGFTTGAATGAVIQIVVFNAGSVATATAAVVGGMLTAGVVYLLSIKGGVTGGFRLVLIGIGTGALLQAANTLVLARGAIDQAASAQVWLSGSLAARTWSHALPVMIGFAILLPVIAVLGRQLSMMEMGDDLATQLGIRVERTRLGVMIAAVALTALATAAAGPIVFVALAAPQIVARLIRGPGVPVVSSALMGAVLLLGADLLTQHLPVDSAVPIGLMTGLVGGIYLLWLLTRARQL